MQSKLHREHMQFSSVDGYMGGQNLSQGTKKAADMIVHTRSVNAIKGQVEMTMYLDHVVVADTRLKIEKAIKEQMVRSLRATDHAIDLHTRWVLLVSSVASRTRIASANLQSTDVNRKVQSV